MELYKWHKGTTRPIKEGLCVVVWGRYGSTYRAVCRIIKLQYYQLYDFYRESGGPRIETDQIISWMPINFPQDTEIAPWHKGTEKPDRECYCAVSWKGRSKVHYGLCETVKPKHCQSYRFYENDSGIYLNPRQVIAYMPIEFPKEVS